MSTATRAFVGRLSELSVYDPLGDKVGRVRDVVVVFSANHCPYVQHVEQRLGEIAAGFADANVQFVAIGSNDVATYPDDDPRDQR